MYAQFKDKMSLLEGKAFDPITVPWEVVDACNGFALDIGGSLMKFLYIDKRTKTEKEERRQGSYGQLCVRSFPHTNLVNDVAFTFLKENACIKHVEGGELPLVLGTGFGTSMLGTKFKEEFGVGVQCEDEFSCFCRALSYMLQKIPRKDVLLQFDTKERESVVAEGKSTFQSTQETKTMLGIRTANQPVVPGDDLWFCSSLLEAAPDKPMEEEKDMFPCVLIVCGSAAGAMLIEKDGTYNFVSDTPLGGKYWLGLGSVLTNTKNYTELMLLAELGNNQVVDMTQADFGADMGETGGDFYQEFGASMDMQFARTVFSFAKVNPQNKDTFKKQDIARGFLNAMTTDLVNMGMNAGRISRTRHVFYAGSFVAHPLVQNMMFRHWVRAWTELAGYDTMMAPVELHFLKHSAHLGALGALLVNIHNNSK